MIILFSIVNVTKVTVKSSLDINILFFFNKKFFSHEYFITSKSMEKKDFYYISNKRMVLT